MDPSSGALRAVGSVARDTRVAWYVVETKRHRERVAQKYLEEKGVPSYAPRIVQWPRPAVGSEIAPMFPGYLFVRSALPEQFYPVTWTPGVKAFVSFGDTPPALDDDTVEFLKSCEGPDGLIRCGEDADKASEVRIIRGPFRGLTAVLEQRLPARDRVRVLMHILQRATPVELPEKWVAKA
jgi:transcription antitermination factor NusG